jgi:hypothetical protein
VKLSSLTVAEVLVVVKIERFKRLDVVGLATIDGPTVKRPDGKVTVLVRPVAAAREVGPVTMFAAIAKGMPLCERKPKGVTALLASVPAKTSESKASSTRPRLAVVDVNAARPAGVTARVASVPASVSVLSASSTMPRFVVDASRAEKFVLAHTPFAVLY